MHAQAAGPKVAFHIPAGSASDALLEFYLQSRVRVLYLAQNVKGVATPAVTGELEASDALAQLLKGTGLTYEFNGEYSAVIKLAPADSTASQSAVASSGEGPRVVTTSATGTEPKLQEVLVTGSLIRGVLDITSPLIALQGNEIKTAGYASIQDVMRSLPIAANITRGEVFAGTGNFGRGSSINLRGLGDGATLVLVNGRRQPVAGTEGDFVDVSNVPWSMVDRIELLPDGGSALYGSDAIAGVVNIILRNNMEGAESQLRYGTAGDGAEELMLSQLVGHDWESGHFFAGYQYSERTSLAAADRRYTANADKTALGGSDFRSVYSNPGNILDPRTLQPVFAIPHGQDGRSLTSGDLLPGVVNYRNQFADVELLPDVRTHNVHFAASQRLSEHLELFAEGRYGQRDFNQRSWTIDQEPSVVPATNPFFIDPFGGMPFVIVAYDFTNDVGGYAADGQTRNYSGSLGLNTELSPTWRASLTASYAREDLDVKDHGQIDPGVLSAALADTNPLTAFNPFGDGSYTHPATLAAIQIPFRYNATSDIPSVQLLADGSLLELPTGAIKAAIGAEYREENWAVRRTALNSRGTLQDVRLGRAIAAAFTELSIPLMGDAADARATPRLELSLAGRYEHYNDFGQTFNPKIGLRWTPFTAIKLRASWGTSFKAPNLIDLDDARNLSLLTPLRDPSSPTGRSDVLVIAGRNSDLKEERATTWTAGFDFAPPALPGFQLSLTGYSIEYEDQVIQPGPANPADILLQEDQWAAVVIRHPSQSQLDAACGTTQFVPDPAQCTSSAPATIVDLRKHNLASTKVRGLDLSLSQTFDTRWGRFNVGMNGAYVFHFKRAFTDTAPVVDSVDTVNNTLALRARGTVEWQQYGERQAGFAAHLTAHYVGDYTDPDSVARRTVDDWTTFDLGLSYRTEQRGDWMADAELAFNVINVLNEDPPFVDREWGYDIVNARPFGRVVSASLSKRW